MLLFGFRFVGRDVSRIILLFVEWVLVVWLFVDMGDYKKF